MNGTAIQSNATIGNVPLSWSIANTGDYNGDGKSDIVWADKTGNVGIWLMDGTTVSSTSMLGNVGTSWTIASLNSD